MLDLLMTPLGRPPLDTYSPTQVVRSAEPMPAGIWEVSGGYYYSGMVGTPGGGLRRGLLPGLHVELTVPPAPWSLARRSLAVQYAPIPALWALHLGYDAPVLGATSQSLEAGTVFEIALPWLTPRVAPRVFYSLAGGSPGAPAPGIVETRVAVGVETRILRFMTLGADLDVGTMTTATVGARFRPMGNLGVSAFFGSTVATPWAPGGNLHGGAVAAFRF